MVELTELELIMHPAVITLIEKKWQLFGRRSSQIAVLTSFIYALVWSVCGTCLPNQKKFYQPLKDWWWMMLLEAIGVGMTIYYMAKVFSFFLFRYILNRVLDLRYVYPFDVTESYAKL